MGKRRREGTKGQLKVQVTNLSDPFRFPLVLPLPPLLLRFRPPPCLPVISRIGSEALLLRISTTVKQVSQSSKLLIPIPRSRSRRISTVSPTSLSSHVNFRAIITHPTQHLNRAPMFGPAHDDGRTLLLLALHGTLPITYASNRYNVPLAVWIPLDFPRTPPIVYVVPTSTMLVRKGNGVALDGRVDDESEDSYLAGWKRKWEVSPHVEWTQDTRFKIPKPVACDVYRS